MAKNKQRFDEGANLVDPETGEFIGTSDPVASSESTMTFNLIGNDPVFALGRRIDEGKQFQPSKTDTDFDEAFNTIFSNIAGQQMFDFFQPPEFKLLDNNFLSEASDITQTGKDGKGLLTPPEKQKTKDEPEDETTVDDRALRFVLKDDINTLVENFGPRGDVDRNSSLKELADAALSANLIREKDNENPEDTIQRFAQFLEQERQRGKR